MKIGVSFANAGPFAYPEALVHLAQTAEAAGVESLWSVEHVVIPVGYKSAYPYDRSGKIPAPENIPIPDPLLPMAYVAAVTKTIRVGTGILILPQRHPLYVAKEAATLDVLSKGRAFLGIGIGWLEEEFDALGIPFKERAARTAETVRAMRSLWKDEPEPFEGQFFRWGKLESNPKPIQNPFPIHVGGHTDLAAKRAARFGDGFFPGVADVDSLRRLLGVMREECARIGRDPASIEVTGAGWSLELDVIRRMADAGVHRVVIRPPAFDPEGIEKGFAELRETVIGRL